MQAAFAAAGRAQTTRDRKQRVQREREGCSAPIAAAQRDVCLDLTACAAGKRRRGGDDVAKRRTRSGVQLRTEAERSSSCQRRCGGAHAAAAAAANAATVADAGAVAAAESVRVESAREARWKWPTWRRKRRAAAARRSRPSPHG
eukprot:364111-Chlamydomonas_euryale.AAC.6